MARRKGLPEFRTTPLSPEEIAKFNILKKLSGKELLRRLPAWARTKAIPSRAEFVSGLPAKYPAWTHQQALAPAELNFPDPNKEWSASTYIAEFNRLNKLKSNPTVRGGKAYRVALRGNKHVVARDLGAARIPFIFVAQAGKNTVGDVPVQHIDKLRAFLEAHPNYEGRFARYVP